MAKKYFVPILSALILFLSFPSFAAMELGLDVAPQSYESYSGLLEAGNYTPASAQQITDTEDTYEDYLTATSLSLDRM